MPPGQRQEAFHSLDDSKRREISNKQNSSTVTSNTSTTIRPALTCDDDYDCEPIWNLPTLDKFQFFAAAHYLSRVQRNQERRPRTWSKTNYPNPKATDIEKKLLDEIALLFARVKGSKDTAQHVTATAIRKTNEDLTIYIAKNNGLQISDQVLALHFSSWFENKMNDKMDDLIRQKMREFWKARHQYYSNQIPPICKKVKASAHQYNDLLRKYKMIGLNTQEFLADWNDVVSFMASCESVSGGTVEVYEPDSDKSTEIGRQCYPESSSWQSNEPQDLANHFRKLVKYIRLFETVPRIWRTFVDFRSCIEGKKVRFKFIDQWRSFSIEAGPIVAALASWNGLPWNLDDKMKTQVMEEIGKQGVINRYFHCELQLLEKFIDANDVVDYFGCSKLSCFMCWGVLNGSRYRTKDTHAKIYPACAFPFALSKKDEFFELVLALKKVQDHLMERVLRRVLDPDHTYTQYKCLSETNPFEVPSIIGSNEDREGLQIAQPYPLQLFLQPRPSSNHKRVQVIQIPQNSNPTLVEVTLYNIYDQKRGHRYHPFANSKDRGEYWVSEIELNTKAEWNKSFLGKRRETGIEIELDYWLFYQVKDGSGEYLRNNEWCMNAVGGNIDPDNEKFPLKGDLYLFVNVDEVGSDHRTEDIVETDFRSILELFRSRIGWSS